MGKQVPKMSARVVNAIRNLREAHGSTSKEIMNYIVSQYSASEAIIRKQMHAALKHGLDYAILKKNNGHYFLNTDVDVPQLLANAAPLERGNRRRRRSTRRRSRRRRSRAKRRRRRRSGRSRRRSWKRRRRGRSRAVKARRIGCTRCRCSKRTRNMQVLRSSPLEQHVHEEDGCVSEKESNLERQSEHGKSRDRSLSRSRSSGNSDREDAVDDRQAIPDQD